MARKATIRTELVRIGNSRGVRLPKAVIEACGLERVVELKVRDGELVVAPARRPRQGWRERFAKLGPGKERPLLGDRSLTEFDEKEWTW